MPENHGFLPCCFLGRVLSYRHRLWTTTPPSLLLGVVGDRPAQPLYNDLTVLEQGEHLARRQELVGFKQGDNRFTIGRRATVAPLKTTLEIAKDAGLSEASMKNRMQAARNIVPETAP